MQPMIILDANILFGDNAIDRGEVKLLLMLSKYGYVKLFVPEVVLLEISRQWQDRVQEALDKISTASEDLKKACAGAGRKDVDLILPKIDLREYYNRCTRVFADVSAVVLPVPDVSPRRLLERDIEGRKPFSRDGRGFRDALIWESILCACEHFGCFESPVFFITNNSKDFCVSKSAELHPDLTVDLKEGWDFLILKSLGKLFEHEDMQPLIEKSEGDKSFLDGHLFSMLDAAISDLYYMDAENLFDGDIGCEILGLPIGIDLFNATVEGVVCDEDSVSVSVYHLGGRG